MKITEKTKEAEKWVDDYIDLHQCPPTYKEVAIGLGIKQTAAHFRCRTFRQKLVMSKKTKNTFDVGTFEIALKHLKSGGKVKRSVIQNDTVIVIYKKELVQMSESTGVRYPYVPSNKDILAVDWLFPEPEN